jgi:hypothetical protein
MTIAERILEFLQERPGGVDDDEICKALGLRARQQANSRCRHLETEGFVVRRQVNGKIRNFLTGKSIPVTPPEVTEPLRDGLMHWFWEGNIQAQVVRHLVEQNYHIRSVADTATRQQGVDIVAERNGELLWVSVKGYPSGTARTNASVQAAHWFKQVIFDMLVYRGRDKIISLGVALPDYARYRSLAKKIDWFQPIADFRYFWIKENGDISVE